MMTRSKHFLLFIRSALVFLWTLFMIGCGGGSSDTAGPSGGDGETDPDPIEVTVQKTAAEGIWNGSFRGLALGSDYSVLSSDEIEILITSSGKFFLADKKAQQEIGGKVNGHMAVGKIVLDPLDETTTTFSGTITGLPVATLFEKQPRSLRETVVLSGKITSGTRMTLTMTFPNRPGNLTMTATATYNDKKYAAAAQTRGLDDRYYADDVDESYALKIDSGSFTAYMYKDYSLRWTADIARISPTKNLYKISNSVYHGADSEPPLAADYFDNALVYLTADGLILLHVGESSGVWTRLPAIPKKPDSSETFYEGVWGNKLMVLPDGRMFFFSSCQRWLRGNVVFKPNQSVAKHSWQFEPRGNVGRAYPDTGFETCDDGKGGFRFGHPRQFFLLRDDGKLAVGDIGDSESYWYAAYDSGKYHQTPTLADIVGDYRLGLTTGTQVRSDGTFEINMRPFWGLKNAVITGKLTPLDGEDRLLFGISEAAIIGGSGEIVLAETTSDAVFLGGGLLLHLKVKVKSSFTESGWSNEVASFILTPVQ